MTAKQATMETIVAEQGVKTTVTKAVSQTTENVVL